MDCTAQRLRLMFQQTSQGGLAKTSSVYLHRSITIRIRSLLPGAITGVMKTDHKTVHPGYIYSIGYSHLNSHLIFLALPSHYFPSFNWDCCHSFSSWAESIFAQSTMRILTHENGKKVSELTNCYLWNGSNSARNKRFHSKSV